MKTPYLDTHTALKKYTTSEEKTPPTLSNLRVDEEGWLFVEPQPAPSTVVEEQQKLAKLKKDIMLRINPELSSTQQEQLLQLILKFQKLIPENSKRPAITPILQHKIENSRPTYVKPYRLSRSEYEKAEELVQEMHKDGITQRSSSPYNSPIVMARKKDGSIRFCVDF